MNSPAAGSQPKMTTPHARHVDGVRGIPIARPTQGIKIRFARTISLYPNFKVPGADNWHGPGTFFSGVQYPERASNYKVSSVVSIVLDRRVPFAVLVRLGDGMGGPFVMFQMNCFVSLQHVMSW